MLIVIDAHEKDYQSLLNGNITFGLLDAIKNGRPLPTAKWIVIHTNGGKFIRCSNCKTSCCYDDRDYEYCPNCGSKMSESEDEE